MIFVARHSTIVFVTEKDPEVVVVDILSLNVFFFFILFPKIVYFLSSPLDLSVFLSDVVLFLLLYGGFTENGYATRSL